MELWDVIKLQIQIAQLIQHRITLEINFIHAEEVYNIFHSKTFGFGQKSPFVLCNFVPRGVFMQLREGRILKP